MAILQGLRKERLYLTVWWNSFLIKLYVFFTSFFSFLFKVIKQELARWSLGISQFFFYVFSFLKKRQTEPTGLPTCVATIILSMTSCMTSISRQVSVDPTNRSLHVAASIPSKCSPKTIPPKTIYYQQYS